MRRWTIALAILGVLLGGCFVPVPEGPATTP